MAESSEPRKSAYPMITVDDAIAKVIAVTDILASTEIISLEDNPAQLLGNTKIISCHCRELHVHRNHNHVQCHIHLSLQQHAC